MPKYQCDQGHTFIYAEVTTEHITKEVHVAEVSPLAFVNDWFESTKHRCPECGSINLSEYVEAQPEIISVKSVDLADVDDWLQKGYVVEAMYAKTATLKKLKQKEPQNPDPDDNQTFEIIDDATEVPK